jgi:hypothetical protein
MSVFRKQNEMKKVLALIMVLFVHNEASRAVTVYYKKEQCPVCEQQIEVLCWATFGSYIYDRESKYDLIYFPFDDPRFVWICANCGYAQAFDHFSDLSEGEKKDLRAFLSDRWQPQAPNDVSIEIRLDQAILVNNYLKKDDDFWAWFNRVLIYHYRHLDPEKAKALARVEIELLQAGKGSLRNSHKTRPYLLGEYNRMQGNFEEATRYFMAARRIDLFDQTLKGTFAVIVLDVCLVALLIYLWLRRMRSLKALVFCTAVGLIGVAILSGVIYFSPGMIRESVYFDDHCNKIIDKRLALILSETSKEQGHSEEDLQPRPEMAR